MRFSIVEGRPGYDPTHQRRVERVTVDGVDVDGCIEADEELGYALKLAPDLERGGFQRDPQGGYVTLRVSGRTEVRLRTAERDWDASRRGEAKVQVGRDANGDVLVQVYSHARPGAIKQMRLERLNLPASGPELCQRAGMCAGAAAEMLAEQFGDRLDPSECARVAVEQASRMLAGEAGGKAG
jgi:hypothetical protein